MVYKLYKTNENGKICDIFNSVLYPGELRLISKIVYVDENKNKNFIQKIDISSYNDDFRYYPDTTSDDYKKYKHTIWAKPEKSSYDIDFSYNTVFEKYNFNAQNITLPAGKYRIFMNANGGNGGMWSYDG